jgi:hypothetical protein
MFHWDVALHVSILELFLFFYHGVGKQLSDAFANTLLAPVTITDRPSIAVNMSLFLPLTTSPV